MPVQYVISEAAHKYGLDNMPVDTYHAFTNQSILGSFSGATQSWQGDYLPAGWPAAITITFSNGYSQALNMIATGDTTAVVTGITYSRTDTGETIISAAMSQFVDWLNPGLTFANENLFAGSDSIVGNSFNNKLSGFSGNDRIDGGAGIDTAFFSGYRGQYQIANNVTSLTVNGMDGFDTLMNVERLKFLDTWVAFDLDGHAGQAYRLYQAALNRKPDAPGLGAQINGLDSGMSLTQISQNFMNSAEFKSMYGENLSNTALVTLFYHNVLHRDPDPLGLAAHVGALDGNHLSRAQILQNFSESPENKAALIGVIQNGIEYQF